MTFHIMQQNSYYRDQDSRGVTYAIKVQSMRVFCLSEIDTDILNNLFG